MLANLRPARSVLRSAAVVALGTFALTVPSAPASAEVLRPGCPTVFTATARPGACWRPFAASSPINQRLRPVDSRTTADSSRVVARLNEFGAPGPLQFGPDSDGNGFGAKAIYYAQPSDPTVRIHLNKDTRNDPNGWNRNDLNGMQVRIPAGAAPSFGSDHHMLIVDQAAGWSYELWHVEDSRVTGSTVTADWGTRTRLDGDGYGLRPGSSTVAGLSALAGLIRPEELVDGDIPHALYLTVNCTNGTAVAPAIDPGPAPEDACSKMGKSNKDAPAIGQRFQLRYTDEQIAGMSAPAHVKVLMRAMSRYGLIVQDVTPADPWHIDTEAGIGSMSLGVPDAGVTFAEKAGIPGYDQDRHYVWHLKDMPGLDGRRGSWTTDLQVIDPCVSTGACPADAPDDTAPLWPAGSTDTPIGRGPAPATPVVVAATATATATATVQAPVRATATATATVQSTATVRPQSPKKAHRAVAKKAAKKKAKKVATAKARRAAKAKARVKATKRARAQHRRSAR